ncbi:MAG: hypothetical protein COW13_03585, partial [Candidatus Omnitrophica bacterium CG12_big_fil_rev_8_21_14_0_65_50_5]
QQKIEQVYQTINQKARVKGFRPGKVPRQILESRFGQAAQQQAVEEIIPEAYAESIQQEKLHPVDHPEICDVNVKDGKVSFRAVLEVKPEIEIADYKGLSVKRKSSEVTDEDVLKTLDYFKQAIPQAEGRETVIDDAFARGMGFPNLSEFKKSLTRQIEMDKDRHNRIDVENQIAEKLLAEARLDVPSSLVKRHLEQRLAQERQHHKQHAHGSSPEEVNKCEDDLRAQLQPHAEREVKLYLIMDKIAQQENIDIARGDYLVPKVMEFLLKEAKWE